MKRRSRHKKFGINLLSTALLLVPCHATAEKGDASLRLEYQFIGTGAFDSSIGDIDIGKTDAHVFMLAGDYAINDRWTLMASLPYVKKRHQGALPHNVNVDFVDYEPPDRSLIDDGNFHSDWEDLYVGVQYRLVDGPFSLAPFVSVGIPSNDYPFYGHAAVGRNLWHVPVGASFSFRPHFSDFFFGGDLAYVFTEKTLGVDTSHWLFHGSVSYHVTARFAPKLFVAIKYGTRGLDFPDDYVLPEEFDSAKWYYHDLMIKHNYTNAGVGFDWMLSDKYQLSATIMKMVNPDQVNIIERGYSLGLTRYFSAN